VNRHEGAVSPVSINGRLFIQGVTGLMAYDAYNGLFLWQRKNPGALRTGVYRNYEPGNLIANEQSVFNGIGKECLQLDAATGDVVRTFVIPQGDGDPRRQWGYLACLDGRLYGTSTLRNPIAEEQHDRGLIYDSKATDMIFAYDVDSGDLLWTYRGKSIAHATVAVSDGRVCFIDSSITSEQRDEMLRQDKSAIANLTGEARQVAEERLKGLDVRLVVALDANTGDELWACPVDVTDCSGIGIGGGQLTLMSHNGYIVLCGANANGHYWEQFLAGEFKRRRLVVLSADSGETVWSKDANYRHRPIIRGDQIIAEPWAFDLGTGAPVRRTHPLTGEETPWMFIRPGHHCGAVSACQHMLFFRSGFTAYYDLEEDSGTRHFGGHRLGCWINTIPANGLVMIPEASAGCACLFSLTSTVVFEPKADHRVWGVYAAEGPTMPVKHLAMNLGGPGDRRDDDGLLWLSFPRPSSRPGLDLPLNVELEYWPGGRIVQRNADSTGYACPGVPWVFASGAQGVKRCTVPLAETGAAATSYKLNLWLLCADDSVTSTEFRDFQIQVQGESRPHGSRRMTQASMGLRAAVIEYPDVPVTTNLVVELIPKGNANDVNTVTICGLVAAQNSPVVNKLER